MVTYAGTGMAKYSSLIKKIFLRILPAMMQNRFDCRKSDIIIKMKIGTRLEV